MAGGAQLPRHDHTDGLLLDTGEFALTFAPGNFAGAAIARGGRNVVREFVTDPDAFLAARREVLSGDAGSAHLGAFDSEPHLFPNQSQGTLDLELAEAADLNVFPARVGTAAFDGAIESGTIKWAVTEDRTLSVVPMFDGTTEISHAVLSRGSPVMAAGQADIAGTSGQYFGLSIDNHSGHFMPSAERLRIGIDAFAREGVTFP